MLRSVDYAMKLGNATFNQFKTYHDIKTDNFWWNSIRMLELIPLVHIISKYYLAENTSVKMFSQNKEKNINTIPQPQS